MNSARKWIAVSGLLLTGALSMCGQDGPRGHWSGSIEVPEHPMAMEIDLDKAANGWIGSISIPAQNASGIPLDAITFTDGKIAFRIKSAPGEPSFAGTLSADGKSMAGELTHGTATVPFKFSRTGDPKVEVVKSSPAVAKEFAGTWEGTLEANQPLRLVLKMSNEGDGAKAVLTSVDQGGAQLAVSEIEQKGSKLTLLVKVAGGKYEAEINKEGSELNGTWTQGGGSLPLKLTKAATQPK